MESNAGIGICRDWCIGVCLFNGGIVGIIVSRNHINHVFQQMLTGHFYGFIQKYILCDPDYKGLLNFSVNMPTTCWGNNEHDLVASNINKDN